MYFYLLSPKKAANASIYSSAFALTGASAKMRNNGSVPEKRQIMKPFSK